MAFETKKLAIVWEKKKNNNLKIWEKRQVLWFGGISTKSKNKYSSNRTN